MKLNKKTIIALIILSLIYPSSFSYAEESSQTVVPDPVPDEIAITPPVENPAIENPPVVIPEFPDNKADINRSDFESIETTAVWGQYKMPVNPYTGVRGVGSVCIEMHLSTDKYKPWERGAYLEIKDLPSKYKTINYMSKPKGGTVTYQEWANSGYTFPSYFPGGGLGYMKPEQEIWYMNMRWEYAEWYVDGEGKTRTRNIDWQSLSWHQSHRKVLVTNMTTGLKAIAYIGDSGPALNLGNPKGNRIAGLSPDLMYYLSNQQNISGKPTTILGADDITDYKFEWVLDQSLPLGPVNIQNPSQLPLIIESISTNTQNVLVNPEKEKIDFQKGTITVLYENVSPITEWVPESPAFLNTNTVYQVMEIKEDWYKIYLPETQSGGWINSSCVSYKLP